MREKFHGPLDSSKCMENFCGFCFIGTEKAIAQLKIHQENFCGLSKFAKTAKLFSRLTFVVYSNIANTACTCSGVNLQGYNLCKFCEISLAHIF